MNSIRCSECHKECERHEVIPINNRWVCIDCAKEYIARQMGIGYDTAWTRRGFVV